MGLNIYLVRHGETDHNRGLLLQGVNDIELNESGLVQAKLVGKRLERYEIQRIYCSDLLRAVKTAEIIAGGTGGKIVTDPLLREIDMGKWEGADWEQIRLRYPQYYLEWSKHLIDMPYPGGESGKDVYNRVQRSLKSIVTSGLKNVVVVTHGGVIKVLISTFLEMGLEKRFLVSIDNCSISWIQYNETSNNFNVQCVNDKAHLE